MPEIEIVGGGLAGCEAAWQLARRGIRSRIFEMRPGCRTDAHTTENLGELVCSNSFRSDVVTSAVGLLKEEMRRLGSAIIKVADATAVPAGSALAVDRDRFAAKLTQLVATHPLIEVERREVREIPEGMSLIATGPLTSPALSHALQGVFGERHLYFYDAIAPIIDAETIDRSIVFAASRYDHGGDDYLNCPMNRDEYYAFIEALLAAEVVATRDFERCVYFEGCMPIEEIARRGPDTLAFGPMKPVGLEDPRTGKRPFAVVQLRQDNSEGTLFNMVGFQTKMTYSEQRRVLRSIPGLGQATFVRLGSLHRNTFVNAPRLLRPTLQLINREQTFLAGQLIGVEGYVESAAAGLFAAINMARRAEQQPLLVPPPTTALGALVAYVTDSSRKNFQPMNANYGLFPPFPGRRRGRERRLAMAERAKADLARWIVENGVDPVTESDVAGVFEKTRLMDSNL